MDATKIALPAWLPWATTACLAALVACLMELWIIERTRAHLLRDESLLTETSLQAAQNQLEAERIVSRRELAQLHAGGAADGVALLAAPGAGAPLAPGRPWGVAVWDASARDVRIRISGLTAPAEGRDYQLWIEAPDGADLAHGLIRPEFTTGAADLELHIASRVAPGYRILLIDAKKGGAATFGEAQGGGSIVLATIPPPGKISN